MFIADDLYNKVKNYCQMLFYFRGVYKVSILTPLDITHSVFADPAFCEDHFRLIAKRYTMSLITSYKRIRTIPLEAMEEKEFHTKWPCVGCENDYHRNFFNLSYVICDNCYRNKNRDRLNENNRKWKVNNPEKSKELNAIHYKKWAENNREKLKAYKAAWYQRNRERQSELAKERRKQKKDENNNS